MSGDFTVTSIMTVVLCPATASALRENTGLTKLRLEDCYIGAEGISHLAQALCSITTLRVLDLGGNTVDSQGAEHLGKLSGGVWGYGLTCNIRQCQCATSNREMSVEKYCCHHSLIPNHKCHIPLCLQIFHMVNIDVPESVGAHSLDVPLWYMHQVLLIMCTISLKL